MAALTAAVALPGCTPTDETFALGLAAGAILGAAAALWRVRRAPTGQTRTDALEGHWRAVYARRPRRGAP